MGTSLSTASPRRVFHDPFRFQPAFHTSFPGFSSDNHVLTRFSYIHGLSTEGSFSRVSFLHIGSTFHISPRHIRGGLQTTGFPLFPTIFIIRSMSTEGISIKRMVKITQSCSIFNSQRYNHWFQRLITTNLSFSYPRHIRGEYDSHNSF